MRDGGAILAIENLFDRLTRQLRRSCGKHVHALGRARKPAASENPERLVLAPSGSLAGSKHENRCSMRPLSAIRLKIALRRGSPLSCELANPIKNWWTSLAGTAVVIRFR